MKDLFKRIIYYSILFVIMNQAIAGVDSKILKFVIAIGLFIGINLVVGIVKSKFVK